MSAEAQIARMQENYEQLAEDLGEVKGMMAQVKEAIMGNPFSGDGGMAARLNKLEKKVEMFERLKWIIIGAAAASGLAIGEIIDKILK